MFILLGTGMTGLDSRSSGKKELAFDQNCHELEHLEK